MDEFPCFSFDDRFSIASFVHDNHGNTTCHTLYCHHTEVFIFRKCETRDCSREDCWKMIIIVKFMKNDIGIFLSHFHEFCLLGIILSIEYENFLIRNCLENPDDQIDPFGVSESCKRYKISFVGYIYSFYCKYLLE